MNAKRSPSRIDCYGMIAELFVRIGDPRAIGALPGKSRGPALIFVVIFGFMSFSEARAEANSGVNGTRPTKNSYAFSAVIGGHAPGGDVFVSEAPIDFKPVRAIRGTGSPSRHEFVVNAPVTRDECATQLTKAVCSTSASSQEIVTNWSNVACDADSASYVPALLALFDEMPELMRPSLCTLSKVFISDQIESVAFASPIKAHGGGGGMPVGGFLGFRRSTFINQPDTPALMSWKEQLAFGGDDAFLHNDPSLVQISYGLKMTSLAHDGLFYVMMHELGHLIDFDNNISGRCFSNCHDTQPGWSALSWQSIDEPIESESFFDRDEFCFYDCDDHLNAADGLKIYRSLATSAFVTSYAATNELEDFAENWAWYQMRKFKNPNYIIQLPQEGQVDMNQAFDQNPLIQAKMQFIDRLWNAGDLQVAHSAP